MDGGDVPLSWAIAGRYLEACNCEAICPCRMVGGVPGGRSTYGVCFGVLSWLVDEGHVGDVQLDGLAAALAYNYDDDVPGSPWLFRLYVDERGDERRRAALADVLLGRLGGEHILSLPWVRKASELIDVRASRIETEHGPRGYSLRVGDSVALRAARPVETGERVSCIVPGHHRAGAELYADLLRVREAPFEWELEGRCSFVTEFAYAG